MAAVTVRAAAVMTAALLSLAPGATGAALVEGMVLSPEGRPAAATVCAWRDLDLSRQKAAACAATGGAGIYRLEVDAGSYFLAARGGDEKNPLFAFHGANPVDISRGYHWIPFFLTRAKAASCRKANGSGVSGTVRFGGAPLDRAMASVYSFNRRQTRGMGLLSGSTGADGRFSFDLEPGRYTVVARWRDGGGMGPLAAGDLFCYPAANPVNISTDERCELDIECYPRDDLGHYLKQGLDDPRGRRFAYRRKAALAAAGPGRETTGAGRGGPDHNAAPSGAAAFQGAVISGRTILTDGTAAAGMLVSAYPALGQEIFQMYILRTRPAAMARSDNEGRYRLRLPGGGKYYLQARQMTGEAPRQGELYGLYCGNANHSLTITAGTKRTADITVTRIMAGASDKRKILSVPGGYAARTRHNLFRDQVIRHDTVWSGEMTVDGVIVVAAGARLTILPGTTVRFAWRDRNRDGIGDGEIRVLGEIRATGTEERPVRFIAAEPGAGPARWSYLMLYAASGRNVIKRCRFSGAFSGMQVHFSTAVIEDCVFSDNNEGLRFGRADITVQGNRFTGNNIGIRFTRMEGPASIRGNLISRNGTGIFLAPSGQNTTDFFNPERSGRPWNTGRLVIRGNTIAANREYDLKLGAKQMWDLDARGNRWSLEPGGRAAPRIFDHGRDPQLGVIRIQETE